MRGLPKALLTTCQPSGDAELQKRHVPAMNAPPVLWLRPSGP
jgi:hypothetical protein